MQLADLARAQRQVLSRAQLHAAGIDRHRIESNVEAGRWQRSGSVVVMHNTSLTREQELWAAVLDQRQPCLLAGITAAVAGGLRTPPRSTIHVLVARGSRPRQRSGVRVHMSANPLVASAGGGVPRVVMDRAIVQATLWESVTRVASGLFIAAFQQGLVTAGAVGDELQLVGGHRRLTLMRRLLEDVTDGAESLAEVDFTKLAARAGLPKPVRQSVRVDADGTRRFLDVDFGRFSVEVDGPLHWGRDVEADLSRQNALVRSGQRMLRFSVQTIRSDPDRVVRELRAAWRDLARSA